MKTDRLTYSYLALREKLHRSALGFLKNDEEAEDALQDTFFNLWRNGDSIETEPEAGNKLFAVLRNICIDRLRKNRTVSIDSVDTEGLQENPQQFEDMKRYESALTAGLTDIQRKIYSKVVHEGREYDEIADDLGMPVEAVRMNMSRARKRIRDNYKQLEK